MRTLTTTSLLAVAVLAACSGSGSGSNARTAALRITATALADPPIAEPLPIPLATGELQVASALFHVGNLEIEMRRSHEGHTSSHHSENEGEGGEHEHGEEGEEGENEHDDEEVVDEIHLPGPYTFELIAPSTVIEEVPVVPGTFDRVEMRFMVTPEDPFLGASIVVRGAFANAGTTTPFTLRSAFHGETVVPIANGGITVTANSVVPVQLTFDLESLLMHLDFASAVVANGEITIDETHNVALLFFFEAGLGGCAHASEHDD